ncbi:MAG: hypothetical protein JWN78_3005 [Bacteroidota bacterium]|nr:hypothetical protein [Bacteroidota bacterium]
MIVKEVVKLYYFLIYSHIRNEKIAILLQHDCI